jgi:predicted DNA-binding transcriptional regulator YafY
MRASRLLSIMMLLQTRGRMTAPALAAELEVSQRTILRDIDQLSASGVPVWSDRGRDGGFQLQSGWSTQLTGLTEAEAQALFLAGVPSAATELGLGGASASAQLKMLAALPEGLRADAQRVSARLHVDAIDWFRATSTPAHLQAVAEAVWHQRVINMRYQSWTGVKDRTAKPLGLVLKAGIWYMVALVDEHKEARTYKLSNIHQLTANHTTFKRPKSFHLSNFWKASTQRFETGIYQHTATVRVTEEGMKRICTTNPTVRQAAMQTAQADPQDTRWTHITIPVESAHYAASQFLGLGAQVEVLAPAELRQQVADAIAHMAALYPHPNSTAPRKKGLAHGR